MLLGLSRSTEWLQRRGTSGQPPSLSATLKREGAATNGQGNKLYCGAAMAAEERPTWSVALDEASSGLVNAWGRATPLGVSRSSEAVAAASAAALREFVRVDDLRRTAGREIVAFVQGVSADVGSAAAREAPLPVEAATVTHCAAGGITCSVAACIVAAGRAAGLSANGGGDSGMPSLDELGLVDGTRSYDLHARLPDVRGFPATVVVMQRSHALVNYGQPEAQAARLAGATVSVVGSADVGTTEDDLAAALAGARVAALFHVESKLTSVGPSGRIRSVGLHRAVELARAAGVPVIVDAAGCELYMREVMQAAPDLAVFSAQKYLAAPTAGLVLGRARLVEEVEAATLHGIGRASKATKEALAGVIAALAEAPALLSEAAVALRHDTAAALCEKLKAKLDEKVASVALVDDNVPLCACGGERKVSPKLWRVAVHFDRNVVNAAGQNGAQHVAAWLRDARHDDAGRLHIIVAPHTLVEGTVVIEPHGCSATELQSIIDGMGAAVHDWSRRSST